MNPQGMTVQSRFFCGEVQKNYWPGEGPSLSTIGSPGNQLEALSTHMPCDPMTHMPCIAEPPHRAQFSSQR